MTGRLRVRTPSRLHFGLLDPTGQSGRRFGGVGLMIDAPGIELSAESSAEWRFDGPLAERAERIVRGLLGGVAGTPSSNPLPQGEEGRVRRRPLHIRVQEAAPEHLGLGAGTQLAAGLAWLLEQAQGGEPWSLEQIATRTGRGRRSAIGLWGFRLGGFLVDGGKRPDEALAPLIARLPFPSEWRVVLILPRDQRGLHGSAEIQAFEHLGAEPAEAVGERCRLVLLELLPALARPDFAAFGEALFHFNRLAGEAFRLVQGGPYAGSQVAEQAEFLRRLGVVGVGQSSWGPAVFALASNEEEASWIAKKAREHFAAAVEVLITRASNQGASVWKD